MEKYGVKKEKKKTDRLMSRRHETKRLREVKEFAQGTEYLSSRKEKRYVSGMLIRHNGNQQLLMRMPSISKPCRFSHRDFERLNVFPVGRCGERGLVKPKSQSTWVIAWGGGSLVAKIMSISGNSTDCSPPGSSVHRISQARMPEWVAISFSKESS